ncbi:MAG: DUF92 domain-containing protein [Candidatus Micrarchaeota archaeon]|nr:DUF92 domain-containing protein [Candidatus Micrarchaeota archaeon]
MVNVLTLDGKGVVLAVVMGALILFFGQGFGPFFLLVIILFLAISAVVTRIGRRRKEGLGIYEKARGWQNVLSNGLGPLIVAAVYAANNWYLHLLLINFVALVYVASVCAVAADKFASEIGVLNGEPIMLLTMKRVKKGTSGAVTVTGLAASLIGSFIISLSVLLVGGSVNVAGIVAVSGFIGGVADSVLGYFEEQDIGNKYTSNFVCSVVGAAVSSVLLSVL